MAKDLKIETAVEEVEVVEVEVVEVHPRVLSLQTKQETLIDEISKMLADAETNTTDVIAKVRECKNINASLKRVSNALAVLNEEG